MFGNKKVRPPERELPYEKHYGYEEAEAAKVRFTALVTAAKAAHELPTNRYRIRRDGNKWWCETAVAVVSEEPIFENPQPKTVFFHDDPFGMAMRLSGLGPRYTAETYDTAEPPVASTVWRPIGITQFVGVFYPAVPRMEVESFRNYFDAERWLTDHLTPEANTVYFSADGGRAIEAQEGEGDE